MKQFTIGLDETICAWLERISESTGQSVESLIANGISKLVISLEDNVHESFIETSE